MFLDLADERLDRVAIRHVERMRRAVLAPLRRRSPPGHRPGYRKEGRARREKRKRLQWRAQNHARRRSPTRCVRRTAMFMPAARGGPWTLIQLVEICGRKRPFAAASISWMNAMIWPGHGHSMPGVAADLHRRPELGIHFGFSLPDREIPPDAGMAFRRPAIVGNHLVEGPLGQRRRERQARTPSD